MNAPNLRIVDDRIDSDVVVAEHLAPPNGIFLVAWLADVAVACGGVRRYDETTGEVKRMYVIPGARRQGLSRVVLTELEARAQAIGYTRLVLETGTRQPEAMALYESAGYESITPYGPRSDASYSRCYAKSLV